MFVFLSPIPSRFNHSIKDWRSRQNCRTMLCHIYSWRVRTTVGVMKCLRSRLTHFFPFIFQHQPDDLQMSPKFGSLTTHHKGGQRHQKLL
jgi:hypothetical protein